MTLMKRLSGRALPRVMLCCLVTIAWVTPVSAAGNASARAGDMAGDMATDNRLQVVVTTSIIEDVVLQVAGSSIDVVALIPRGRTPHSYEPPPSAYRSLETADIVFVNGFGLEEGLLDTIASVATGQVVSVSRDLSATLDPGAAETHDADHDASGADTHDAVAADTHAVPGSHSHLENPHVWMDPTNVIVWVRTIVDVLSEAVEPNAGEFRQAGDQYIARLTELDRDIERQVSGLSPSQRRLGADHDSISSFADRYGFEVIGTVLPGMSDSAEPSAAQVSGLVDHFREHPVALIMVGESASRGTRLLVDAIARDAGGSGKAIPVVHILTGTLAASGSPGDTYLGMMSLNLDRILNGLEVR